MIDELLVKHTRVMREGRGGTSVAVQRILGTFSGRGSGHPGATWTRSGDQVLVLRA